MNVSTWIEEVTMSNEQEGAFVSRKCDFEAVESWQQTWKFLVFLSVPW